MKIQKIRGHKRRWKDIDRWVFAHKSIDMDNLQYRERDYVKIRLHPWGSYSLLNSEMPIPKGKTRMKMLEGLIKIYDSWKIQLDELGQPYYLKIWLFEPRFMESQVVCGIGNFLEFYDTTFFKPQDENKTQPNGLPKGFQWECRYDEDHLDEEDSDIFKNTKTISKPWVRLTPITSSEGTPAELVSLRRGRVWLGGRQ